MIGHTLILPAASDCVALGIQADRTQGHAARATSPLAVEPACRHCFVGIGGTWYRKYMLTLRWAARVSRHRTTSTPHNSCVASRSLLAVAEAERECVVVVPCYA